MTFADAIAGVQRLALTVFGEQSEPVLYHPEGAGSFAIEGIFREAGVGVDVNLAAQVRSDGPELHVRIADVLEATGATKITSGEPADAPDAVTVKGTRYTVGDFDPDGEGMAVLFLKEGQE